MLFGRMEVASEIEAGLRSRRIALVGIPETKALSIARTLKRVGIFSQLVTSVGLLRSSRFDGVLYDSDAHGMPDETAALALLRDELAVPVLVIGYGDDLLARADGAFKWATELLIEPWSDTSLLLAVSRLLSPVRQRGKNIAQDVAAPLILIADDDPDMTNFLQAVLRGRKIKLSTATDGNAAIGFIRQRLPDAVLLDVNMPGLDGLAVLAKIRQELGLVKLPIAMLTSYNDSARVSEALRLGANDYIVKPFQPAEIAKKIEHLMSLGGTNRELGPLNEKYRPSEY
jgi:CheY-like chemotaxis protein